MTKGQKEVLHPIFLQCCQFATDAYWDNIFEDLAYGKTPHGCYISKNFICSNQKKKAFSYQIDTSDPEKTFNEVYNLFVVKLGLISSKEKAKRELEFRNTQESLKEMTKDWKTIQKKPTIRDILIEQYIVNMKRKHSLSVRQMRYLLSVIFLAMTFKVIVSSDIDYHDGQIHSIKGIDFEKHKINLDINLKKLEVSFSPQIVNSKKLMSESWEKFIISLQKE